MKRLRSSVVQITGSGSGSVVAMCVAVGLALAFALPCQAAQRDAPCYTSIADLPPVVPTPLTLLPAPTVRHASEVEGPEGMEAAGKRAHDEGTSGMAPGELAAGCRPPLAQGTPAQRPEKPELTLGEPPAPRALPPLELPGLDAACER